MTKFLTFFFLIMVVHSNLGRASERPNIVFIFADDLGWSDLGCYGSELFETPHLDSLARQGVRFTQAYSAAPICSASRASVLTGNSTARNHFEFVVKEKADVQRIPAPLRAPPYTISLPLDAVTIPEVLANGGYRSAFFGKWHLNPHHKRYLGWSPTHGPLAQGFQTAIENFGSHPYGYSDPKTSREQLDLPEGQFPPDGMTDLAIKFLQDSDETPFFLMVSHFYVHDPIHTRVRWLYEKYLGKIDPSHPRREQLAHYGAMVTTLDHHVGQLLAALEKTGQSHSTLVVFSSDNGGHPNYAGNAPLRGSKWNLYEGGIREPLICRWPDVTQPESVNETTVWLPDLLPTFAEVAGVRSTSHDGVSLLPLLKGENFELRQRPMVWHFPYYHPETRQYQQHPDIIGINDGVTSKSKPHSAIREGNYKLIHFYEDDRDELYDIQKDPGESRELSSTLSDVTKRLHESLFNYLSEVQARLPTVNPDDRP